jgi:hypothetical protein
MVLRKNGTVEMVLPWGIPATIGGNIFVWEANITGIDRWRDGMEWTIWEEDGFEVGEAIDDSGLIKKSTSPYINAFIMWCPTIRHMMLKPWLGHQKNLTWGASVISYQVLMFSLRIINDKEAR